MRTTLTLEDDVAADLKRFARERGSTFKDAVNQLLRRALRGDVDDAPYESPLFSSGVRPGFDLDQSTKIVADLEDAELTRKFEMGK